MPRRSFYVPRMNEIVLKKQAMEMAAALMHSKAQEHAKKPTPQTTSQMEAAQAGLNRATRFIAVHAGKPQCPNCWIRSGRGSDLSETGAGQWSCSTCFAEFETTV